MLAAMQSAFMMHENPTDKSSYLGKGINLQIFITPLLPLGAVGMAWMTLVVGLGIFEDETVGPLQPVRAFVHAVGSIFEVEAFYTLVGTLKGEQKKKRDG